MPIYEYVCSDCQAAFEMLIRGQEKPRSPKCESLNVDKQLSVPAAATNLSADLPVAGNCGRPQCGTGCAGLEGM